jgi:two-component system, OmpR family, sensor histidine kinase CiaH
MFQSARLKLTLWYFIIITSISLFLTLPLYFNASHAFTQLENAQATHTTNMPTPPFPFLAKTVPEARANLTFILFTTNAVVISLGSILGYFLAGRTLKPIKIMVDEQNRFISDASHELRTPLTALRSELEFMKMEYQLPEKVKDHITSTLEEVTNMQVLTDDLLILSKNQYIKPNIVGEVSLLDVLETAIKKVVPLAREKKITIDNQIKDVTIRINHQSLSQVFVILLDNAIKYSDINKKITVTTTTSSDRITINFIDEGIGITEENRKHVFERFYRGDKSRSKSNAAGYGLGLAIAIKIIESYKGTIQVKSVIDKGSTFSVMLPIAHA